MCTNRRGRFFGLRRTSCRNCKDFLRRLCLSNSLHPCGPPKRKSPCASGRDPYGYSGWRRSGSGVVTLASYLEGQSDFCYPSDDPVWLLRPRSTDNFLDGEFVPPSCVYVILTPNPCQGFIRRISCDFQHSLLPSPQTSGKGYCGPVHFRLKPHGPLLFRSFV